MKHRSMG